MVRVGIERRYQADVQGIQDRAFHIVKADQIWRALTGLLNLAWGPHHSCRGLRILRLRLHTLSLDPGTIQGLVAHHDESCSDAGDWISRDDSQFRISDSSDTGHPLGFEVDGSLLRERPSGSNLTSASS